ncbi:MAG: TetR family transcriptional regulator [Acidimicrobiales bacterium]
MSRTGRRPGSPETRDAIVEIARHQFAERGYDATSLRAIAAEAHVDPALLIHYFGSKETLFVAATDFPIRPSELYGDLASMPPEEAAAAIARRFLEVVDSDRSRNAILALVRSAVSNERAASMLREFLTSELLNRIGELSERPDASRRAGLVAAQLIGVAMLRHVVKVGSLADATAEELVDLLVPAILRYLE